MASTLACRKAAHCDLDCASVTPATVFQAADGKSPGSADSTDSLSPAPGAAQSASVASATSSAAGGGGDGAVAAAVGLAGAATGAPGSQIPATPTLINVPQNATPEQVAEHKMKAYEHMGLPVLVVNGTRVTEQVSSMTTFLSKTVADRQYTDALKDDIKGRVKKIEDAITAARACTVRQLKLETCCALCIFS